METKIKIILIAEDNRLNQRLMEASMKVFGFRMELAENGLEAVEKYQEDPYKYGLILMDVMMPVMDGLEASRRIRIFEKEKDFRIPIIALTANTFNADRERCLSYAMDDYLSKPFTMDQVTQMLRKFGLIE